MRSEEIMPAGANQPSTRLIGFIHALLAAASLMIAGLALTSAPAMALTTHSLAYSFPVGPCSSNYGNTGDIALHYATNTVYTLCPGIAGSSQSIRKFDTAGNPVNFSANQPSYISNNKIFDNPDPASRGNSFGNPATIAVDNSGGPNDGDIFVATPGDSGDVDVFSPSGKWIGSIPTPTGGGAPKGIAVDEDGYIYVETDVRISKYDRAFNEIGRLYFAPLFTYGYYDNNDYLSVDSTGGLWAFHYSRGNTASSLYRYEADQFGHDYKLSGTGADVVKAATQSPYAQEPMLTNIAGMGVDPSTDELYVDRRTTTDTAEPRPGTIRPFSPALPGDPSHQTGPDFGSLASSWALAVAPGGTIYALTDTNSTVNVYAAGDTLPIATTHPPNIDDVGHDSAVVTGKVDPNGGDDITGCQVQYGTQYDTYDIGSVPCTPDPSGSNFSTPTDVSATLSGLSIGQAYHYRVVASNTHGQEWGGDREVAPVSVLHLHTGSATNIDTDSATLHGSLNPDSMDTTYHFDYGLSTDYRQSTADLGPLSGGSDTPVSIPVAGLQAGKTYHYRLVGVNNLGPTYGPDVTFKTAGAPEVSGVRATGLSTTDATLNARVNPEGYATTYHFEYGTTPAYGTSVPAGGGDAGSGDGDQAVSFDVHDLQPGVVYHFRVVATNQWGTSNSDDTTFSFAPPSCPNQHIRQQTGANFLPDCRAYELVSPGKQGSAVFWPSNEMLDFGAGFGLATELNFTEWPQYTGQATSPARFTYLGGLGSVPGLDAPNSVIDTYLATRTNQGWVTTFPGIKGSEQVYTGRRMCSDMLDKCIDHIAPDALGSWPAENAPFAFDASGKALGRWPTNVNTIPGGARFFGDQQPSGDFNHYVFSSRDLAFAPGGLTSPPGSAYDNDTVNRTVTIISKLPNGDDIHQDGGNSLEVVDFPPRGVSEDGSHILMTTAASDGPQHLYMRVNDSVTYDVSKGFGVHFVGMTKDGSKVVFSAVQQVTPDDTDTSLDLYEWNEQGDTVTLISKGNGNGNSDACNASYTTQCNADPLVTERGPRGGWGAYDPQRAQFFLPGLDSQIATGNGAVYFYSPESLDPNKLSTPNERNLYVYRDGAVHFVATLDPGTQVNRFQLSPDGVHAAFLTTARLTGYDNQGFREMYTFDDSTGALRCASCDPSGAPPTADVTASVGGPFMSDDGRAFFATPDSLVPQDTDGIIDVYEFVEGRPQLISTGTGTRDFNASGAVQLFYVPEHIGLEAVSADGADVFFTTYDTLVQQDQNGSVIKFYDARTNGGFEPPAPLAPCVAADECHGPGSSPTTVPTLPSGADLGSGNAQPVASKRHHKKNHRQRRHRRHPHHHRGQGNG